MEKVSVMQAWFDEGLAVNFEVENPYPYNTRFWYLKDSLSKGTWIPLAEMISKWTTYFRGQTTQQCYNECGGFVYFLTRKGSTYRKAFLDYLKQINKKECKPSSIEKLEKILGKKLSDIETEFKKWVKETPYKGPRGSGK
jgi:hypothetical protein